MSYQSKNFKTRPNSNRTERLKDEAITEGQVDKICYEMMRNGIKGGAGAIDELRKLSKWDAGIIIEDLLQNHPDWALAQMKHLGLNIQ